MEGPGAKPHRLRKAGTRRCLDAGDQNDRCQVRVEQESARADNRALFLASPTDLPPAGNRARGRRPLHAPVPPPAPRDHPAAGMLGPRRPPAGWHAGRVPVGARGGRAQVSRVGGSRAGAGVRWGPLLTRLAAAGRPPVPVLVVCPLKWPLSHQRTCWFAIWEAIEHKSPYKVWLIRPLKYDSGLRPLYRYLYCWRSIWRTRAKPGSIC